MTEYDNRNRGVLFKNERKERDSQPDYKGSFTDGENRNFWLSAWINKDQDGNVYMSLQTTRKEGRPQEAPQGESAAPKVETAEPGDTFPDSEIPF